MIARAQPDHVVQATELFQTSMWRDLCGTGEVGTASSICASTSGVRELNRAAQIVLAIMSAITSAVDGGGVLAHDLRR